MNIEQQRAAFEAWYQQHHGDRAMYGRDTSGEYTDKLVQAACNAWQAALASPQVQAWKKDAERYQKLRAMATQQANTIGPIFRIDVQRSAPYLFNFDAAIDHARRVDGGVNE